MSKEVSLAAQQSGTQYGLSVQQHMQQFAAAAAAQGFLVRHNPEFGQPPHHGVPVSYMHSIASQGYHISNAVDSYQHHLNNAAAAAVGYPAIPSSDAFSIAVLERPLDRGLERTMERMVDMRPQVPPVQIQVPKRELSYQDLGVVTSDTVKHVEKINHDGENDSSDEDDAHQCGRCREVFYSIKDYLTHKKSKICKLPNSAQQTAPSPVIPLSMSSVTPSKGSPANILEAAANSTIFRDSLIPMEEPTLSQSKDVAESSPVRDTVASADKQPQYVAVSKSSGVDGDGDNRALVVLKLVKDNQEVCKKRRGRPPKSECFQEADPSSGDLMQKGKRKSRPPRRHDPYYPSIEGDTATCDNDYQGEDGIVAGGSDGQSIPDGSVRFMQRGGGRGRGRGRAPSFRCPVCQLLFPSKDTLSEHKAKHAKLFKCKICNEAFFTEDKLDKHTSRETHCYSCDECERMFVSKQALLRHKPTHSEKVHSCDLCSKCFKTPRDLNNHKVGMHSDCRDYACEICGKGFPRKEKLKRHLLIHAADRPIYTCPFKNHVGCEKTFYRKDKLTRHLYSHSKVKPFKCEQCDKSFARTDNLREHIRSHTGVFRYYCTVCGKGQPGPKKFLHHMLKQHNIENPEIPRPFEELAPEPLVQQHKAVVQAETAARLARAANNMKREREKVVKMRKASLDDENDMRLEADQVTLNQAMSSIGIPTLQAVPASSLMASSPPGGTSQQQLMSASRAEVEALYSVHQQVATSQHFQIPARHLTESMVRHMSDSILRDNLVRESLLRDGLSRENGVREQDIRDAETRQRLQEGDPARQHLVETPHLADSLRRQLESGVAVHEVDNPSLTQALTITAEGTITASSGGGRATTVHLFPQSVLPGNLQFTALLNSDLVAIGESVARNQAAVGVFQHKFASPH